MIIQVRNNQDVNAPITYTTFPEVAGTNVLRWQNPSGFTASWAIQVGATGAEKTEVALLGPSTPAGTAGTLTANDSFDHPADTPIYGIKYDQVVYEVSLTGTSGAATPITNGTVTYQPNSNVTIFDHTSGLSTYAYKTYFRNSVSGSISTESDWITSAGFPFASLGRMRQRVKDKLYNASYIPNDSMIDDWFNEWLEQMNNTMVDVNEDYGLGTTSVAFAINVELGTITASNFRGQTKRVWYVDATGTFPARKMDSNQFNPNTIFVNVNPYYYMQGDAIIGRKPLDTAGTLLIEYPLMQPLLVNDDDLLPIPMFGYTSSFVNYALGQAKNKDNKAEEGAALEVKAEASRAQFTKLLTPRLRSSQTTIDIVETTGNDDVTYW